MLEIKNISKSFGGLMALRDISLDIAERQIYGLIGPNGAGKTTLFNLVTGYYPATAGAIRFFGQEITGLRAHEIARLGIARTFQNIRLFGIARALALKPKLLLLDEPAAGMNEAESADLLERIREIREMGRTVLLIEHDMKVVMGICDRIAVLSFGELITQGTPEEIQADDAVIDAYLGREDD